MATPIPGLPPLNPLQVEYNTLQSAIAGGVTEVRFQDRTVRYASVKDMILAANYIYQQLAGTTGAGGCRQVRMFTNKGL
jgi:hypothetical protein